MVGNSHFHLLNRKFPVLLPNTNPTWTNPTENHENTHHFPCLYLLREVLNLEENSPTHHFFQNFETDPLLIQSMKLIKSWTLEKIGSFHLVFPTFFGLYTWIKWAKFWFFLRSYEVGKHHKLSLSFSLCIKTRNNRDWFKNCWGNEEKERNWVGLGFWVEQKKFPLKFLRQGRNPFNAYWKNLKQNT